MEADAVGGKVVALLLVGIRDLRVITINGHKCIKSETRDRLMKI